LVQYFPTIQESMFGPVVRIQHPLPKEEICRTSDEQD
jgi:hypothetical protein